MMDSGPDVASGVGAEAMIMASLFVNAMLTGACIPIVELHLWNGAAEKTTDPGSDPAKIVAKSVPGFGADGLTIAEMRAGNELPKPFQWEPMQPGIVTIATAVKKRRTPKFEFIIRVPRNP